MVFLKNEKSPGPDGIIPIFYKLYWEYIKDDLYEVFEFSYEAEELSYSQYLALIILLYKKGIREDIRNWRPISLSNCDIKILTKAFAERLRVVLPHIIDVDPTGCVKGRRIGHSIRLINDVFDEYSCLIQGSGIVDVNKVVKITRLITKADSTIHPRVNEQTANVQNVYLDENKILVASS